ncbi:MAG: iron-sulfur cluster assembly protein [Chloroflexota bacterium]|nr:iron-sulfur cluster assembly protein [Chloroflexota bacterium]
MTGLDQTTVDAALISVTDPALGENIVDLGYVRSVRTDGSGAIQIDLRLPSEDYPPAAAILQEVRAQVAVATGAKNMEIKLVRDGLWTPYDMSDRIKVVLGLPSVEPPPPAMPRSGSGIDRLIKGLMRRISIR